MYFEMNLPNDVKDILKREYPDKSIQAAFKAFVRDNDPQSTKTTLGDSNGKRGTN